MQTRSDPQLLNDEHVLALPASEVVATVRTAIQEHAAGRLAAPPRLMASTDQGRWVFTVGGTGPGCQGFRAYGVGTQVDDQQLVAVWSREGLQAVVVGSELGIRRTAGIGAVAADLLARSDARTVGLIGAGRQGLSHVRELAAVRELTQVRVFSRTPSQREDAAGWIRTRVGVPAQPVDTAETAASGAELVTLATSSQQVVVDAEAIAPGTHVTTLGPKFARRHELPIEVAERATAIVTDSLAQLDGYDSPFFLDGRPERRRIAELSTVLDGGLDRPEEDITLFCSVGLAGIEPSLAQAVLRHAA